MDFDLSHYDVSYYLKKKKQYEEGKAWKIIPFFQGLKVKRKTVLDYGSAAGNMAKEAVKKHAKFVIAYDPIYDSYPEIIELIQSRGVKFLTTRELQKLHDEFDLIFCSDVIEHVIPNELEVFVADLVRFAHEKTIICINSPVKINLAFIIGRPLASSIQGHINVMNPWDVIKLFKNHGFKLINKPRVLRISKKPILKNFKKLPYPLNSIWGGHYFLRFIPSNNA